MPNGYVAQGDTNNAADCRVAFNRLKTKLGTSNVYKYGFSTLNDTPLVPHADQSIFIGAKNYNILYWSSHGNPTPSLNVTNGPMFGSYSTAYSNWRSTSYALNVPIFAACYQFDGDTNRSHWANNIMRHSDIRAMCGYHGMAPSTGDDTIANKFFTVCGEAPTGNSVMFSWKNANATTTDGDDYIILVYYDNYRCYYRLPGFSSVTYPDPIRSSTKIYRYTKVKPNGAEVPKSSLLNIDSAPYHLNIKSDVCRSLNVSKWNPNQTICVDSNMDAFFYGQREYSMKAVSSEQGRAFNEELLNDLVGNGLLESASLKIYDDAMAEVPQDDVPEEDIIIGSTTQVFQHYNGIILEDNCIAACSDASGVISLTNQWQDYSVEEDVDHIDLLHKDNSAFVEHFKRTLYLENEVVPTIKNISPIYIRIGDKFILHYKVVFENKQHILIDAKEVD